MKEEGFTTKFTKLQKTQEELLLLCFLSFCVNVNAIAPGVILTDINRAALSDENYRAKVTAKIPWGRIGSTEDIARGEFARGDNPVEVFERHKRL